MRPAPCRVVYGFRLIVNIWRKTKITIIEVQMRFRCECFFATVDATREVKVCSVVRVRSTKFAWDVFPVRLRFRSNIREEGATMSTRLKALFSNRANHVRDGFRPFRALIDQQCRATSPRKTQTCKQTTRKTNGLCVTTRYLTSNAYGSASSFGTV
ncbi:Hypothetical protein CINCED_3A022092 [Cinara cedri]|uniref:Uncharacterized protein n=1 Tax=Cinara cedri TaxID=506608 RepID=A0A5E4M181_9HEMI|nr:Hypothetical protein CINCED_3A022092 [Cinara cedri]